MIGDGLDGGGSARVARREVHQPAPANASAPTAISDAASQRVPPTFRVGALTGSGATDAFGGRVGVSGWVRPAGSGLAIPGAGAGGTKANGFPDGGGDAIPRANASTSGIACTDASSAGVRRSSK